jgi:hypothetical protein
VVAINELLQFFPILAEYTLDNADSSIAQIGSSILSASDVPKSEIADDMAVSVPV